MDQQSGTDIQPTRRIDRQEQRAISGQRPRDHDLLLVASAERGDRMSATAGDDPETAPRSAVVTAEELPPAE